MKRIAIASMRRDPHGSAFCYKQDIANEAYINSVLSSNAIPLILPYLGCDNAAEALRGFSALLIPGGHDIDPELYSEEPTYAINYNREEDLYHIALINAALKAGIPILGICRGMQLINVALGGTLYQDIEKEYCGRINHKAIDKPYEGCHRIAIKKSTALYYALNTDSIMVNSLHHQAIKRLGKGLSVSAESEDGVIEAIEGNKILAVQWHPEAMYSEMKAIFRSFIKEAIDV